MTLFFSCFFFFFFSFFGLFVFVVAFFNLCKHDGDEERLARFPQTRLWFWAVNAKHTLEQTPG